MKFTKELESIKKISWHYKTENKMWYLKLWIMGSYKWIHYNISCYLGESIKKKKRHIEALGGKM